MKITSMDRLTNLSKSTIPVETTSYPLIDRTHLGKFFQEQLYIYFIPFLLIITLITLNFAAQADEQKGLEIAAEARNADRGFENYQSELIMTLRNKQGQEIQRSLRIKVLEVSGDGNQSLFIFDSPRDVKGTALLIHGHLDKADEQWLYLPALKRVKRISSSNKSGSFVGSEFAYEDLGTLEIENYTYNFLQEESCGDLTCTVTEYIPKDKESGYTRLSIWHDTDELRIWKIEYFDRKNTLLKTLTNEGYEQYLGKFWRSTKSNMVNHVTGKSTELSWNNFEFQGNIDKKDFTQNGLRRAR